ncbi:hypothetical protein [Streptomyces sp. Tu 3180]|uniref:hypothetical protein n=1 Tax=Streptomyces sp. Tu 3180 TaxID=2682611 RepID=UPI001FB822F1|nr:hypothetical protein [Streptomyces sp. Tu 3180]
MEALIGTLTVLGLLVLMVLPAVIGIVRDRRIDRQIRRAEAGRAAAERRDTAAPARTARGAASRRAARDATSHRTARAA